MTYGLYLLTLTLFLVACQSLPPAPVVPPESVGSPTPTIIPSQQNQPITPKEVREDNPSTMLGTGSASAAKVIDVSVHNWAFSPENIVLKKGEKVILRLRGESGVHGFAVPDFGINKTVRPGEIITVDLPTEKAGSYRFFCSVSCGEGHIGMNGTIVVE